MDLEAITDGSVAFLAKAVRTMFKNQLKILCAKV